MNDKDILQNHQNNNGTVIQDDLSAFEIAELESSLDKSVIGKLVKKKFKDYIVDTRESEYGYYNVLCYKTEIKEEIQKYIKQLEKLTLGDD